MKEIHYEHYTIRCGQNSSENDLLISQSHQDDLWFHLDKMSSPHVVISKKQHDYVITNDDIYTAANMVKDNSKARYFNKIYVISTNIKKLKKTGVKGEVNIIGKVERHLV